MRNQSERNQRIARVTHPHPLVLIHGLAQTAVNWMTTPDGGQGWAEWFGGQGWQVCLVDQSARGRSAWQPQVDGAVKSIPVAVIENLFTAPEDGDDWPEATQATQSSISSMQARSHNRSPALRAKSSCRRRGLRCWIGSGRPF
jgi:pimeloyl-ACP methyl ester carboxylesterase